MPAHQWWEFLWYFADADVEYKKDDKHQPTIMHAHHEIDILFFPRRWSSPSYCELRLSLPFFSLSRSLVTTVENWWLVVDSFQITLNNDSNITLTYFFMDVLELSIVWSFADTLLHTHTHQKFMYFLPHAIIISFHLFHFDYSPLLGLT